MPDMDGYEVISVLKSDERTRHIPVIFITGLVSIHDEEQGLALQAADYISKPFSPIVVQLRVRNQIQIISQMRTIEIISMTDQLTGIPNRRSFDSRFEIEWNRSVRDKLSLALLMIDVDHFKAYNDAYGHQQGDVALQTVAQSFSRTVKRATDFFARWGGEEFAILLSHVGESDALRMAELVRREVAEAVIPEVVLGGAHVTVSIGINIGTPTKTSLITDFIIGADSALYAAKQAGRNCVRVYDKYQSMKI